jgi:hypothetical protein
MVSVALSNNFYFCYSKKGFQSDEKMYFLLFLNNGYVDPQELKIYMPVYHRYPLTPFRHLTSACSGSTPTEET